MSDKFNSKKRLPIYSKENKKHIFRHKNYTKSINDLLSLTLRIKSNLTDRNFKAHPLDDVYDFYSLYNGCNASEFGIEVKQLRNVMKHIGSKSKKSNDDIQSQMSSYYIHKYLRKKIRENDIYSPLEVIKQSHIHDGANMKKAIRHGIEMDTLDYSTRRQLDKIDINNRLYILKIHHKHGVLRLVTKHDFIKLLNSLIKVLKELK